MLRVLSANEEKFDYIVANINTPYLSFNVITKPKSELRFDALLRRLQILRFLNVASSNPVAPDLPSPVCLHRTEPAEKDFLREYPKDLVPEHTTTRCGALDSGRHRGLETRRRPREVDFTHPGKNSSSWHSLTSSEIPKNCGFSPSPFF